MYKTDFTQRKRSLSINDLNPDMIKCAIEHGYKMPCVSVSHHFGKSAIFIENNDGNFELDIFKHDALVNGQIEDMNPTAIYLIPKETINTTKG